MKGYIKQIIGEGTKELYWFSVDIEDVIVRVAYRNFVKENDKIYDNFNTFEVWWNLRNSDIKIERIFIETIYL